MAAKIAFEAVGNSLNQWYGLIRQNHIAEAAAMREEIKRTLETMEENQDVLLYFNLIDSRFKLLTERYEESGTLLQNMRKTPEEIGTDNMLQYYFYFFGGMYEFYQKNFTTAINFYKIAEQSLHKIPDEIEIAEFHYQLSIAYYEIRQNFFSINHAEKALESFLAIEHYEHRAASTQMIIAANKLDLFKYESAEALFQKAINMAADTKQLYAEALGYHNLGICYERQEKLDPALKAFASAFGILEQLHSKLSTLRTSYMLARVLFKKGLIEEATGWYKKAAGLAAELDEKTYKAKLLVINSIYKEQDEALLDKGLDMLRSKNLWSDAADLAINAARYFKSKNCLNQAAKYFDEGIIAFDHIQTRKEELAP
ncbi:Rap family tetratricopeptide repeat protein [Bacillus sp. NSP9.1]|uniref:Rap family tetratricopeptide repeat protein n=1 Tax=Bacillus sp. NSP9.1 TaxID=1071078 RepID=UPI000411EA01|nr:Rap family tetratricopeptide repeat protein [Bacillus sp. NSP9.1]QHZ45022.1 tetratricopeptide repeat protein [Bacillus sp. NSP9.1]